MAIWHTALFFPFSFFHPTFPVRARRPLQLRLDRQCVMSWQSKNTSFSGLNISGQLNEAPGPKWEICNIFMEVYGSILQGMEPFFWENNFQGSNNHIMPSLFTHFLKLNQENIMKLVLQCWGNRALSIIMYLLTLGAKYARVSSQCGTNYVGATQLQNVISLIKLLLSEISNKKCCILINN